LENLRTDGTSLKPTEMLTTIRPALNHRGVRKLWTSAQAQGAWTTKRIGLRNEQALRC
jgi:hypothetical protein